MKYLVAETLKDVSAACEYFQKQLVLGLDCETTSLEPWLGNLRLIQISDGNKTVIIDVFHLLKNENKKEEDLPKIFGDQIGRAHV